MKIARMLRLLAGTVALRFAGAALGLVTQLLLAMLLVPHDLGVVFLTLSSAAILSLLVTGGYPNLALTQLPRLQTLGLGRAVRAFHGAFVRDFLLWNLLLVLICVLAVLLRFLNPDLRLALLFGTATAGISGLLRYNSAIANGLKQFVLAYVPDSLIRPGLFFLFVAAAALTGYQLNLISVLLAFIASNLMVVVGQAVIMDKNGVQLRDWWATRQNFTRILRWRAAAVMITAGLATMFADIVTLVGGFVLLPADVAILGICIRLSGLAGYVLQASQQFSLPDLTEAFTRNDTVLAYRLLLRLNLLTLGSALALLVGTFLLGGVFLRFFGAAYQAGYGLLVICMIGQVIRAGSGMNQILLAIHGYQKQGARAALTAVVIFVCTAILLGMSFGAIGVGYALLLAELAWAVSLSAQAKSLVGRRADLLSLLASRAA